MNQHPIDLLPEAIRVRSEAGVRTGRSIAAVVLAVVILVVLTTHARFVLDRSRIELANTQVRANHVLAAEAQAVALSNELTELRTVISDYREIAHPVDFSAIIASLVSEMPTGLTFDRIDLDAAIRRPGRSPRSRGVNAEEKQRRQLVTEISGFALSDQHIADFVSRLADRPLFQNVSLDFTRSCLIQDKNAREFRVSFQLDFEAEYIDNNETVVPREVANVP